MASINSDVLLAVALVINRSRDGPAFVFHYPPHVGPVNDSKPLPDNPADLEDTLLERLSLPADHDSSGGTGSSGANHQHHRSHDDHLMTESGSQIVPWENVAGFPTRDLAGILTPARSYHKKLFQISLDPLYCVSCPIHVPENGKWKKSKKSGKAKGPSSTAAGGPTDDPSPGATEAESAAPGRAGGSSKESDQAKKDKDEGEDEKRSSMTMFNLIFILNPKRNDAREIPSMLYSNIIKKINRAYKYSQQHSDFVWKESKRILAAKETGREDQQNMSSLWAEILSNSSLALSVRTLYEAVSQNKIAVIHLETTAGVLSPSVQIPVPFYVSDLPAEEDTEHRGLWLTTANAFMSQDVLEEPGFLDRNFALLLVDDAKKIVAELQADRDPSTEPLIEFVRLSKPTMSFYQLGQNNVLTLSQVRKYAQHFIFWRRAIAIPPLHARDTYIVSPNCDLARLAQDSHEWQRVFPAAPPLPAFLSELSSSPRPYKSHCPAKSYRPIYLQMLAWLMRGGWVTQLCTFAYVVVWPEILYEVEHEIEAEEIEAAEQAASQASTSPENTMKPSTPTGGDEKNGSTGNLASSTDELSTSVILASPTSDQPLSPAFSATYNALQDPTSPRSNPLSPSSLATNTPTLEPMTMMEQTAERARLERIAAREHQKAADKATAHARKTVPKATTHPSINDAPHLAGLQPYIIQDAKKATGIESRYLAAIARRFDDETTKPSTHDSNSETPGQDNGSSTPETPDHKGKAAESVRLKTHRSLHQLSTAANITAASNKRKLRAAWQLMGKYFDGQNALERIALQEDMKRKEVWGLLTAMSEYLLCVRHW